MNLKSAVLYVLTAAGSVLLAQLVITFRSQSAVTKLRRGDLNAGAISVEYEWRGTSITADNLSDYNPIEAQKRRQRILEAYCLSHGKRRSHDFRRHVMLNIKVGAAYCAVGKVASSAWIDQLKRESGDRSRGRQSSQLRRLMKYRYNSTYFFKFMFVRHPYDRLLSAYRSKFLKNKKKPDHYVDELAPKIIRLYRTNSSSDSNIVTFNEFTSYITDRRSQPLVDFHWTPQIDICPPCKPRWRYDFVGHYETLYQDARHVLSRLGHRGAEPTRGTQFGPHHRQISKLTTWKQRIREAFRTVPTDHVLKLKLLYRYDFEAFDYDPNVLTKP